MSVPHQPTPPVTTALSHPHSYGNHQLAPVSAVQYPLAAPLPQPSPAAFQDGMALRNIISIEDVIRYLKRYWKLSATVGGVISTTLLILLIGRTPLLRVVDSN